MVGLGGEVLGSGEAGGELVGGGVVVLLVGLWVEVLVGVEVACLVGLCASAQALCVGVEVVVAVVVRPETCVEVLPFAEQLFPFLLLLPDPTYRLWDLLKRDLLIAIIAILFHCQLPLIRHILLPTTCYRLLALPADCPIFLHEKVRYGVRVVPA